MQLVNRGVRVPKMQKVNVLSDFKCFPRFKDAMQAMEVQIMALKIRMKSLITKCTLKLLTAY